MCFSCRNNHTTFLCVDCRKVWKDWYSGTGLEKLCPTCCSPGRDMGIKWRAPRLTNKRAWRKIASGEFDWDSRAIIAKAVGNRLFSQRQREIRAARRRG